MSKRELAFWNLLQSESVLTLAMADSGGSWSAPVLYVAELLNDRPVLYFLSSPNSRHIKNLLPNGAAAASVYANYCGDWQAIRGLQMEGFISVVGQEDSAHWQSLYFARFPEVAEIINSPQSEQQQKISVAFAKAGYYCFSPSRICATDNSQQFASRQQWDFS